MYIIHIYDRICTTHYELTCIEDTFEYPILSDICHQGNVWTLWHIVSKHDLDDKGNLIID